MKYQPFEPDRYYHLYNRGNNRENIFFETKNYLYFLKLISQHCLPWIDIYSYCLLPNHFHFILKIKNEDHLPIDYKNGKKALHQPFSNCFNAYSKAINKSYMRSGSLFQEHLKRIEITSPDYLQNLIIYVNTNPDKHEIAHSFNYRFSSYQSLITNKNSHICREEVIELFGDVQNLKYMFEKQQYNLSLINELTFE